MSSNNIADSSALFESLQKYYFFHMYARKKETFENIFTIMKSKGQSSHYDNVMREYI